MTLNANPETPVETEEWVQVGHYSTLAEAYDHGLVILAMGEACRVTEAEVPGGFDLEAEMLSAGSIAGELAAYGREIAESSPPPSPANEWTRHSPGLEFCGIWVALLIWIFHWQNRDPSLVDRAASSSIGLIERGEWWRPFTALFLHADFGHLLGNLSSGMIFATLVSRMTGPLRGWILILGCGTLGNAITSWHNYPKAFLSLGASTAVFAALGILAGLGLAETLRERAQLPWARITAPILAGLVLLSWLGSGGDNPANTDVMGHVFGFGSGLVAGAVTGAFEDKKSATPA